MWLLVMRPGGLIHSSGGRTAFIIVFTIFGYATTFQNVTRDYSMLASIALNGATIVGADIESLDLEATTDPTCRLCLVLIASLVRA